VIATPLDRRARRLTGLSHHGGLRWLLDPRASAGGHPLGVAAAAVGGKKTTLVASALAAAVAARARGPALAAPFLVSYAAAFGLHGALKPALGRRRPWVARLMGKRTPSFPSGHAARVSAVAGLIGYAAVVEGLARPRVVVPLGVAASLASGGGRLVNERHWATDIVGGWGLGVAVAALCALWYERLR
jgi:membrane-associated phospholipid phosphatase